MSKEKTALIVKNKNASRNFKLDESFQAGIVLEGWEVKSLRDSKVDVKNSYVNIRKGEAWLIGVKIDSPASLQQENIANTDVFCALTNNGESNIMMSMLAKRLGAKKVITLITNPAYAELVGQEIDIAISPQQITISSLLTHVRKGDISNVHSLRRGAAEALEITAHGSPQNSKVVGRRLDELDLPSGTTVGAILRGNEVIIAHGHVVVEEDDHIILFLTDPTKISLVEKLFVVGGSLI